MQAVGALLGTAGSLARGSGVAVGGVAGGLQCVEDGGTRERVEFGVEADGPVQTGLDGQKVGRHPALLTPFQLARAVDLVDRPFHRPYQFVRGVGIDAFDGGLDPGVDGRQVVHGQTSQARHDPAHLCP